MAEFGIDDLWYLKPGGGQDPTIGSQWLQGMKFGADLRQQNIENAFRQEQLRNEGIKMKAAAQAALAKQITDAQKAKGLAELSGHLATVAEESAWGDPKSEAKFWSIASQYAPVFDKDELDKIYNNSFAKHQEFKLKADEADRKAAAENFVPGKPITTDDGMQLIEVSPGKWQQAKGNETIETYTDDQGHQQVRIVRGTGKQPKDPNAPTTATTTKLQEGLLASEKAIQLGANTYNALTPEAVGIKGQFNKVLVNEGLAQIFPEVAKGDVAEAQTLLGNFNEKAIQALTASGDRRVSDKDMERFKRILPKMTAGESLENARTKIKTFLSEVRREARVDAKTLGKPLPEWAMTQDEIIAAIQSGAMTKEHGRELVQKYQIPQ